MNSERHKMDILATSEYWRILQSIRDSQTLIYCTPHLFRGYCDDEHILGVLEFIKPHNNVIDYELLPYHRFGLGKYESLGVVYELDDYKTPSDEVVKRFQAMIDKAFGRDT
jgi:pyruvate formate lyase activating enzyme